MTQDVLAETNRLMEWLRREDNRLEDIFGLWVQGKKGDRWVAETLLSEGHIAALVRTPETPLHFNLQGSLGGTVRTPVPEVRTPETLDAGTTTDCPLEGVHEHSFRGPHRFHEWDPSSYFTLNDRPPVRTPETLDVERPTTERAAIAADRTWASGYSAGRAAASRALRCNCPESGTSGSCPFHDNSTAVSPSSLTPPEGLLGSELEKAYRQGFDDGLARRAHLAASPAPDPGAGLREALWQCGVESGMDTDGDNGPGAMIAGMGDAGFAAAMVEQVRQLRLAYDECLAPSAEPPETT